VNWSNNQLPNTGTQLFQATEKSTMGGDAAGQGVVFDPTHDPNFTGTGNSLDPYVIYNLYLGNSGTTPNKLSIKSGTLNISIDPGGTTGNGNIILGRSTAFTATIVQLAGNVQFTKQCGEDGFRLRNVAGSTGVYEYHGGNLEVATGAAASSTIGIRIGRRCKARGRWEWKSSLSTTTVLSAHIQTSRLSCKPSQRRPPQAPSNFHYGKWRACVPIQVEGQFSLRNSATQSSRLALILNQAPTVDANGIPQSLGSDCSWSKTPRSPGVGI